MKEFGKPTDRSLFKQQVMYGKKIETEAIVRDIIKDKQTFNGMMNLATILKKNHPVY